MVAAPLSAGSRSPRSRAASFSASAGRVGATLARVGEFVTLDIAMGTFVKGPEFSGVLRHHETVPDGSRGEGAKHA
jgi:hypothetical protein